MRDLLVLLSCDVDDILAIGLRQLCDLLEVHLVQVASLLHLLVKDLAHLCLDLLFDVRAKDLEPAIGEILNSRLPVLGVLWVKVDEAGVQVEFPVDCRQKDASFGDGCRLLD